MEKNQDPMKSPLGKHGPYVLQQPTFTCENKQHYFTRCTSARHSALCYTLVALW
jgi:hypothetical protein